MRVFHLLRLSDVTGVSGTGRVAEGVMFSHGLVALTWLSEFPTVAIYPSIAAVEAIHGHDGRTLVVPDGTTPALGKAGGALRDTAAPAAPSV